MTFLMFVQDCGTGVVILAFGRRGAFPFVPERRNVRIGTPEEELPRSAKELAELGTVERLRERVRELRQGREDR